MKTRFAIIFICLLSVTRVNAFVVDVRVDENVELMSILARMAGYREYSHDRAGDYITDMDSFFADFKEHQMVSFMQEIRRDNGISYDAVMSMAVRLDRRDGSFVLIEEETQSQSVLDSRWEDVDKEKFLSLLTDFYKESRFAEFFQLHHDFYQKGLDYYRENMLKKFNSDWYASFYGIEPKEKFSVIIGFCNGGSNYGPSRHPKGEEKEVFAVVGYYLDQEGNMAFAYSMSLLLHEFNHSFVNHLLTDERQKQMQQGGEFLYESAKWSMRNQAYAYWSVVVNESIVRAAVVCYMLDNGFEREAVEREILSNVQRGYRWLPDLVKLLRTYEKKQKKYRTLDNFYPQIVKFFNTYAAREQAYLNSIK